MKDKKVFGSRRQAPRNGDNVMILSSCHITAGLVFFSQIIIHHLFKPPSMSQSDFLNSGSL